MERSTRSPSSLSFNTDIGRLCGICALRQSFIRNPVREERARWEILSARYRFRSFRKTKGRCLCLCTHTTTKTKTIRLCCRCLYTKRNWSTAHAGLRRHTPEKRSWRQTCLSVKAGVVRSASIFGERRAQSGNCKRFLRSGKTKSCKPNDQGRCQRRTGVSTSAVFLYLHNE